MLERADSNSGAHFEAEYGDPDRTALVVPGRFTISWEPAQVRSLGLTELERFVYNIAGVRRQMEREATIGEDAVGGRTVAEQDFADILGTPSVAVDYPDRNLRCYSDGTSIALNPVDEIVEPPAEGDQIPNLWNDPA